MCSMRPRHEIELVASLISQGVSDSEIARMTGIPRRTVLDWRRTSRQPDTRFERPPAAERVPGSEYAYLLGVYLGDGCISSARQVWRLRIAMDAAYPDIIEECRDALRAVGPEGNRVGLHRRRASRCVDISMYWKHWPWLIPQHGPGPKHQRKIELAEGHVP